MLDATLIIVVIVGRRGVDFWLVRSIFFCADLSYLF